MTHIRNAAAILIALACGSALAQLGAADDFTVLGGTAVTCTDSTIVGDVGVDLGGAITRTNCTIVGAVHDGDMAAQQAYDDFLSSYAALAMVPCDAYLTTLSGQTLAPGTYCVAAAATETGGVLTLAGSTSDQWIFKIGTGGTGALTGTNFSVVMAGGGPACDNNVLWWTSQAATLTDSTFIGSILAGTSITVTGGSFDGQALATAAVTLTNTEICGSGGETFPPAAAIKVTGGGQIPVAGATGRATFGFNAQPGRLAGTAKGHLNYVNHSTGLHINGTVTRLEVIAVNADGSPKTVRFSGTCTGKPTCAFSVTVEDHGEPGTSDEFGIRITGGAAEVQSQRIIARGDIQFHRS